MNSEGVIVAISNEQEWMLKWWWKHYRSNNSHPVTFFDIGMSKSASLWCEKHGDVLPLTLPEKNPWFAKPFALLNSPYPRTVWINLDCQVRRSIAPLFPYCIDKNGDGFSIVLLEFEGNYYQNSGVLSAKRHSPVTAKWAENASIIPPPYQEDDTLLISTINENRFNIPFFPTTYNHPTLLPGNESAAIRHYTGSTGKHALLKEIF